MGVYAKFVLPRFIDFAMRNKEAARVRRNWVPHARGDVLEVGIGSGLNLPFYSREVGRVYGVEPSLELVKLARKHGMTEADGIKIARAVKHAARPTKRLSLGVATPASR